MYLTVGFFDESTDTDTTGICYTVAGFIGSQHASVVLEMRWKDLLEKYGLEYFKASELNAGTGQFQKFRDDPHDFGWRKFSSRERNLFDKIKTEFTDTIVKERDGIGALGAVVILPDLERLRAEYPHASILPHPYFLCAQWCMMESGIEMAVQNYCKSRRGDPCFLRPIFDQQEEFSGRAKNNWDSFRDKNPRSSEYLLCPHYESELQYLSIQAADNIAFEVRKYAVNQGKQSPREAFKRLLLDGNAIRIVKFDYETLKLLADNETAIRFEDIRDKLDPSTTNMTLSQILKPDGE